MKKILAIFLVILSLSCCLTLTSCKKTNGSLDEVTFVDASFKYDGKDHKVEVGNLPDGYTVEYIPSNVQKEAGEYRIIAKIKDSNGKVVKEMAAMLIIVAPTPEEPASEEEHECDFSGEWVKDETHHWHECECGETDTKVEHSGGEATTEAKAVCEVCGQEYGELKESEEPTLEDPTTEDLTTEDPTTEDLTTEDPTTEEHECDFTGAWEKDETHHWHECECGETDTKVEHSGGEATETEQAECEVCGQTYGELKEPEDELEVGYVVEVNGETYQLNENLSFKPEDEAIAEYMALGLNVCAGDKLILRLDGSVIDRIGPSSVDSNVDSDMCVVTTATSVGIYVKQYPDGGYSVWLEGKSSGSTGGEDQGGTTPSGDTITIYFSAPPAWWGDVTYAYYWPTGGEGSWPGVQMTYVETNGYGQKVFSITVDLSQYQNIIFHNNNGWQTNDISLAGATNNTGWYIINNEGNEVESYIYGA